MIKNIVSLKNEVITINFEKLFKRKVSQFNEFKIVKRAYHKSLSEMYVTIKEFIEDEECLDYAYNLLYFKYNINSDPEKLTREEVINFIKEHIFKDEKVINKIKSEVNDNYSLALDDSINDKNENLQITDDLNRKYLQSAMLMRLLLPIISAISDIIVDTEELDKYIFDMVNECMLFFNDYDDTILKKIYNIVSSRIIQTRYSDKDIWEFLKKQNKDILVVKRSFNNYILINNFIKIMNGSSIISYIDVVLRNKIKYLFKLNYKVSHKTLDYYAATNNSDDTLTEINKLESTLLRKDKGLSFINRQSIKMEVDKLMKKYKDDECLDEFKEVVNINEFTRLFMSIYYKKKFDIRFEDTDDVYVLLYDMLDVLRMKNFNLIPEIMISTDICIRAHNKRIVKDKLSDSVKYKLLLQKYNNIENLVNSDKNFISDILVGLKQKKFVNYEGEELELDLDSLKEEVLDFLYL